MSGARVCAIVAVGLASLASNACSSSNGGDGADGDGGGPASFDGSASETGSVDAGRGAASDASEAGKPDSGASCSSLGTTSACRMCCSTAYAAGFASFEKLGLVCACQPSVCGALDAGAADGGADASDGGGGGLGSGACAVTCATSAASTGACTSCLQAALGSESAPGPCGATVAGQCLTDSTCGPFFECVESCP